MDEVLEATAGRLIRGDGDQRISGVSTDSRSIRSGELFVALVGDRFDGHDFVGQALERGACGAAVEVARHRIPAAADEKLYKGRLIIGVADTLEALGAIAAFHRRRFSIPVVGITGSNGKTTTKEMAAAILSIRHRVHRNSGNLNNQIGLPLTVLALSGDHDLAIFEMGINRPDELPRLCATARPQIGIVTNIGAAHLEGLGNLDGVARAKSELVRALPADGVALLNADDAYLPFLKERAAGRVVTFGFRAGSDMRIAAFHQNPDGIQLTLQANSAAWGLVKIGTSLSAAPKTVELEMGASIMGRHNALNAAAAALLAWTMGLDLETIREGLSQFQPVAMRTQRLDWNGATFFVDAYNANPTSMAAALDALAAWPCAGKRIALLGEMLELGAASEAEHAAVGKLAATRGVVRLIAAGQMARVVGNAAREAGIPSADVFEAADLDAAAARLKQWLRPGDVVLMKGSRGARIETVLEILGIREERH